MYKIKALLIRFRKPLIFAFVGAINTGVDFLMFSLILFISSSNIFAAQIVGYIAGLTCSFFLNKYFTFENKTKSTKQVFLFLLINGITMSISLIIINFVHNVLEIQEHIAKLFFVTPMTMVLNYLGYKYIVFREKKVIKEPK